MKWEYKTIQFIRKNFWTSSLDTQEIRDRLNEAGQDGWELVSFATSFGMQRGVAVLKRLVN